MLSPRILVVDDNRAVHEDFSRILGLGATRDSVLELERLEASLFGDNPRPHLVPRFELQSALQGEQAVQMVQRSVRDGLPFALAFVDMRMPPGWDGIETIRHMWAYDPNIQVVICTAYSDYSWPEILDRLGRRDNLLILKKPFDPLEVCQMSQALTEKWRLSRQLASHLENLESQVCQRTAELEAANQRLREEAAERRKVEASLALADRMATLGTVVASTAHDINNPCACVLANHGLLKMALKKLKPWVSVLNTDCADERLTESWKELGGAAFVAEILEALSGMEEAALRIRDSVQDLTALALRDSDSEASVELDQCISTALRLTAAELVPRATVIRQLEESVSLAGSSGRLCQVFINLLMSQARSFDGSRPAGENWITIASRREGEVVAVTLTDNGPGMTPEQLALIFQWFDPSRPPGVGSSLGLALSREIVRQHGGEIEVESTPGVGSQFTVRLPLAPGSEASAPAAPAASEGAGGEAAACEVAACEAQAGTSPAEPSDQAVPGEPVKPRQAGRARILFVDDEPSLLRYYSRLFGRQYDVVVADSGASALEVLAQNDDFALIISDCVMPNISGLQLYEQICQLHPHLEQAFVFITGCVSDRRLQDLVEKTGKQVLEKPFELEVLRRLVAARIEPSLT